MLKKCIRLKKILFVGPRENGEKDDIMLIDLR